MWGLLPLLDDFCIPHGLIHVCPVLRRRRVSNAVQRDLMSFAVQVVDEWVVRVLVRDEERGRNGGSIRVLPVK